MDNRKQRTVVYNFSGCTIKDEVVMEKWVEEVFGEQLVHSFGIAIEGRGETPEAFGGERWSLRREIERRMLGDGGKVKLPLLDCRDRFDWTIAVMVKDPEYLKSEQGMNAVINFAQVECIHAEVLIPPPEDSMDWDDWVGSVMQWIGYVGAQFGDGAVFNVDLDMDEDSEVGYSEGEEWVTSD